MIRKNKQQIVKKNGIKDELADDKVYDEKTESISSPLWL